MTDFGTMGIVVIIGLAVIAVISVILGGYLGSHGYVATFADSDNPMRVPLLLLSFIPVPLVFWLQEAHGYVATIAHIGIVFGCFIGGFIVGNLFRR